MSQMTKDEVREKLGNIDQIRDIIFGAQMREYDARLEQMRSDMGKHQQEVGDRLDHLKTNLTSEIKSGFESLEKKLKTFNTNHAEEAADLRQQIERLNRKLSSSVEDLDTALEDKTKAIKTELTEVRDQYQGEILMLRDMILAELEDRSQQLQAGKVSRFDMAEALFEMGLRLQGSAMIPTLQNAVDQQSVKTAVPTNEALRKPVKPEKAAV
jgi:predicted nuclease of restriction endonuclease-like RecB superfamily